MTRDIARPVLSEDAALEVLAYLVSAARTQVDEAAEYGPMRLMTAARRLAEHLGGALETSSQPTGPATARALSEIAAQQPTATPTRDREAYVARLDVLGALVADALLEAHGLDSAQSP